MKQDFVQNLPNDKDPIVHWIKVFMPSSWDGSYGLSETFCSCLIVNLPDDHGITHNKKESTCVDCLVSQEKMEKDNLYRKLRKTTIEDN